METTTKVVKLRPYKKHINGRLTECNLNIGLYSTSAIVLQSMVQQPWAYWVLAYHAKKLERDPSLRMQESIVFIGLELFCILLCIFIFSLSSRTLILLSLFYSYYFQCSITHPTFLTRRSMRLSNCVPELSSAILSSIFFSNWNWKFF